MSKFLKDHLLCRYALFHNDDPDALKALYISRNTDLTLEISDL